ncbi:MAG: hypothetical protein J6P65_01320 [Bacteroidales bacterium]|nr:hypothetical protein [Bacteroidales bacterium]
MNWQSYLVLAIVLALVVLAVVIHHRRGSHCCNTNKCNNCNSCSNCATCNLCKGACKGIENAKS